MNTSLSTIQDKMNSDMKEASKQFDRDAYPQLKSNITYNGGVLTKDMFSGKPVNVEPYNSHPWLNNLEELALQLESDEQLPHQMYELILDDEFIITVQVPIKVGEYYRSANSIIQGTISIVNNVITCIICSEMHNRRQAYKLEKAKLLLSEEALIIVPTTDNEACVMLTALAQMSRK